jgi:hypothetical protein
VFGGEEMLEKGYTIRGRKKSEEGLLALPLIIVSCAESRINNESFMESCVTREVRALFSSAGDESQDLSVCCT